MKPWLVIEGPPDRVAEVMDRFRSRRIPIRSGTPRMEQTLAGEALVYWVDLERLTARQWQRLVQASMGVYRLPFAQSGDRLREDGILLVAEGTRVEWELPATADQARCRMPGCRGVIWPGEAGPTCNLCSRSPEEAERALGQAPPLAAPPPPRRDPRRFGAMGGSR